MGHHRKILLASSKLARGKFAENWPEIFKKCSIDLKQRPEQLSPEDYIAVAKNIEKLDFYIRKVLYFKYSSINYKVGESSTGAIIHQNI